VSTRLIATVTVVAGLALGLVTPAAGLSLRREAVVNCISDSPPGAGLGPKSLVSLEFSSSARGWAVGGDRVLRTVDAGNQWSLSYRRTGADFFQVDAFNDKDAWALGTSGIAHTTDGGVAWTWLRTGCPLPLISSIDFFSPRGGIAVAGTTLLRTADAGRSWHRLNAPRDLQSACLSDGTHGWAGAHGQIYRTTNGGRSWRLNAAGPKWGRTREITTAYVECAGPGTGWAELDVGEAAMNQSQHVGYHLTASGSRAIFAENYFPTGAGLRGLPNSPGPEPSTFSAISPSEAAYVDFCGPCGSGSALVGIVTGGSHLEKSHRVQHLVSAQGAAFLSATDGWVVGSTSQIARHPHWRIEHTTDGGRTWATQYQS
jgi:photosystem II stability/assembly factor-like uncharacterized protein